MKSGHPVKLEPWREVGKGTVNKSRGRGLTVMGKVPRQAIDQYTDCDQLQAKQDKGRNGRLIRSQRG